MSRRQFVLMILPVFMLTSVAGQSRTDFSGHWLLVPSQPSGGSGRGGAAGGGGTVSIVSGAVVNCGTECTITQAATTLTLSRPANDQGIKPPDVVVNLDGTESTITQSLNPPALYKAEAKWDGNKLVVTRSMGYLSVTQTLTLEDGRLRVVSLFSNDGAVPFTLTYTKG